jgi:hypothetical protein
MVVRTLAVGLAISGLTLAQPPGPATPTGQSDSISGTQPPGRQKMTVEDKLRYDGCHLFDVENLTHA